LVESGRCLLHYWYLIPMKLDKEWPKMMVHLATLDRFTYQLTRRFNIQGDNQTVCIHDMQQNEAILNQRLVVGFGFIENNLNPAKKDAKNLEMEIMI